MSDRLRAVAELVPRGSRAADIGTDHGRLARLLVVERGCPTVIVTERRRRPRPPRGGRAPDWARRVDARQGDGLEPLRQSDRVQTIVIAGLGARSIVRILDRPGLLERLAPSRIVLQPQSEAASVRAWARRCGRGIVDERLVGERGRLYEVIAVDGGVRADGWRAPADLEADDLLEVGPVLLAGGGRLLRRRWTARVARFRALLERPAAGEAARLRGELARAERILDAIGARSGS